MRLEGHRLRQPTKLWKEGQAWEMEGDSACTVCACAPKQVQVHAQELWTKP